jgi:histidine triad (HIT) family protein
VLVVPKIHISSADEVNATNSDYVSAIFEAIPVIARECGLENGYRVITNIGEDGAQSVKHLHFHVLGGEKLPEKMGN